MTAVEQKQRDKYGRTVYHVSEAAKPFHTLVVIVSLPRVYREAHPGQNYLVNDWQHPAWLDGVAQGEAEGKITYVRTLAQARALAASKIA
jgi:hypothetical protein